MDKQSFSHVFVCSQFIKLDKLYHMDQTHKHIFWGTCCPLKHTRIHSCLLNNLPHLLITKSVLPHAGAFLPRSESLRIKARAPLRHPKHLAESRSLCVSRPCVYCPHNQINTAANSPRTAERHASHIGSKRRRGTPQLLACQIHSVIRLKLIRNSFGGVLETAGLIIWMKLTGRSLIETRRGSLCACVRL